MARILVVGRGAPERGGIRTAMETLLSSELARRHRLSYLNLGRARGTVGGRASGANLVRTASDLRAVWRNARGQDIVHLHSAFAPGVTAVRAGTLCLAARLRGASPLLHLHGGRFPGWAETRSARWIVRTVALVVERFAVVSRRSSHVLADIIGVGKVRTVPNGVDTERFRPGQTEEGAPVILYVGILTPRKGLLDLFEASVRLRSAGVDHRLWLAGGIPDEGRDASDTVREAAPPWAEFLGEVGGSLPRVYSSAAVFCLPSWWEAAPLTVLEAQAAGLPVVATRVGDIPDMVEDGGNGLLIQPRDVEGLSAALGKLLESPDLRREMGIRSRRRAEELFSVDSYIGAVEDIYRGLV